MAEPDWPSFSRPEFSHVDLGTTFILVRISVAQSWEERSVVSCDCTIINSSDGPVTAGRACWNGGLVLVILKTFHLSSWRTSRCPGWMRTFPDTQWPIDHQHGCYSLLLCLVIFGVHCMAATVTHGSRVQWLNCWRFNSGCAPVCLATSTSVWMDIKF